jgi:hypothetical protein
MMAERVWPPHQAPNVSGRILTDANIIGRWMREYTTTVKEHRDRKEQKKSDNRGMLSR